MTTTLKQYADDKVSLYEDLKATAQSDLTDAVDALAQAREDYDTAAAEHAALLADAEAKRAEIAAAPMPSDIEALAEELRVIKLAIRAKRVDVLEAEADLAEAEAQRDEADARLQRTTRQVRDAEAELEEAKTRQSAHDAWQAVIDGGSLTDLAAKATDLLDAVSGAVADPCGDLAALDEPEDDEELIVAARLRVECDIPESLRTRARERVTHARLADSYAAGLVAYVEDKLDTHVAADEGSAGASVQKWGAFLAAEDLYGDFVLHAPARYDEAVALLQSVWDSTPLTAAQKARIGDTDLKTDGEAAMAKEKERDEKEALVLAKLDEIEKAKIDALVADVDADPEDDATVSDLIDNDLPDLNDDLETAETAYTADMQEDLDRWESAVPDPIWANLVAYDQAVELLTAIKNADPATLALGMTTTQDELATALAAEDKAGRLTDALGEWGTLHAAGEEFLDNTYQQRISAAARGDL